MSIAKHRVEQALCLNYNYSWHKAFKTKMGWCKQKDNLVIILSHLVYLKISRNCHKVAPQEYLQNYFLNC